MGTRQNSLILITVDCLRADHCGFHGYSRPTTPFLDTLATEAIVMPSAIVAGAPTYYSLPAILASRMPLALGRDVIGLAPGEQTLATALQNVGYATAAFSAANPYISQRFGYQQGFDVSEDFLGIEAMPLVDADSPTSPSSTSTARGKLNRSLKRAAHAIGLGSLYDELYFQYCLRSASRAAGNVDSLRRFPTAERIVDRALSWLQGVDTRPFFLWLHLMDPHSPYYPTAASYRELTGKEISAKRARYLNEYWNRSDLTPARLERKKASIVELYDAGIRGVDSQIARLVSHLQQSGRWDECTFAFTADHGEEFLDHGRRYHAPVSLHEEVVRVPLMIRVPGVTGRESAKKEIAKKGPPPAPFSHVHLAPTLLDLLGVPSPAGFQGTSLWRNLQAGTPWEIPAVTECVHGCTNPLPRQDRMGARLLSVRSGPYKLTLPMESDLLESNSIQWSAIEKLYNLGEDPKEERPLPAGAHREIRGRLLRAARTQLRASSNGARASLRLKARLRDLRVELQSKSR